MKERSISFDSGGIKVEALLAEFPGTNGAVISHPHPLYGGDMHNSVVEAAVKTYTESQISILRFNFQGVGRSEGSFDQGLGEQENVMAAVKYVYDSGRNKIDLVGYSFGAWINARCAGRKPEIDRLIFISPPLAVLEFSFMQITPSLKLIVTGSRDTYAPPSLIEKMIPSWNPAVQFEVIDGADHFYQGYLERLRLIITGFLA